MVIFAPKPIYDICTYLMLQLHNLKITETKDNKPSCCFYGNYDESSGKKQQKQVA